MRLSRKQKSLALKMFGTADMTRREFQVRMKALKETREERYEKLKDAYQEADETLQLSGDIIKVASDINGLKLKQDGRDWWSGPCPECGGTDRFYINTRDNKYKCRQCSFAGGLANLASFAWGVHLWDAIDTLLGYSLRDRDFSDVVIKKAQANTSKSEPKQELFKDFSRDMVRATNQLEEARGYLISRGITSDTIDACQERLGFAYVYHHDSGTYYGSACFAHELPLGGKWLMVGINRRIFDPPEGMDKTRLMAGSKWGLLRFPALGRDMLIVVEGEINGLSIWQVIHKKAWRVDVISVGSEGAFKKRANYITELAKPYQTLVLWGDDGDVMQDAITSGPITHDQIDMIVSPNGLDANDLLQARVLGKFLLARLPKIAQEEPYVAPPAPDVQHREPFPLSKDVTYHQNGHVKDDEAIDLHHDEWDAIDEARLFIECSTTHDDRFAIYKVVLFNALVEYLIDMEMRVITENEFYALLDEMNIDTSEDLILSRISLIELPQ